MSENLSQKLVMRFFAELIDRTRGITDNDAYQRAAQAFVDELVPWFPPDAPRKVKSRLFDHLDLDERTGIVSVEFSAAGRVCFRAWCNRQGLNPLMSSS